MSNENDNNNTRARNKTVMLTPDMANQMRSRLSGGSVDVPKEPPTFSAPQVKPERTDTAQLDTGVLDEVRSSVMEQESPLGETVDNATSQALEVPSEILQEQEKEPVQQVEEPAAVEENLTIKDDEMNEQVNATPAVTSSGDAIQWEQESSLVGFLVSFDNDSNGEYFVLRSGRLIVSSDASSKGNLLLLKDDSVSGMHAIMKVSSKTVIVLDQLSEGGTTVRKPDGETEELCGDKSELEHGDMVSFGERNFKVCLIG